MEIFGKYLFGSDACWFRNTTKENQRKWIAENTKHTDKSEIEIFLNSKFVVEDECVGCKDKKNGNNISSGNGQATATVDKPKSTSKHSSGNSHKGQPSVKK